MKGPLWAGILVALVLVAPLGSTHGNVYDPYHPLSPTIQYYLLANHAQTAAMPNGTTTLAVPQNTPATPGPPVQWNVSATHKYNLTGPVVLHLWVCATLAPIVGNTSPPATAWFLVNGKMIGKPASAPAPAPLPVYQRGVAAQLNITMPIPETQIEVGDALGLAVQFNWPNAAGNAVYIFSGDYMSVWSSKAAVGSLADLGVHHEPGTAYGIGPLNISAPREGDALLDIESQAESGFPPLDPTTAKTGQTIELRLISGDPPYWGVQHEDGTGGLIDPYTITVQLGSQTVAQENLYSGEWVLKTFVPTQPGTYLVSCTSTNSCFDQTPFATIYVSKAAATQTTNGTPSSGGTPSTNTTQPAGTGKFLGVPGAPVGLVVLGLLGAAALMPRRKRAT
ncbi:MAG: hypothetical protein ACYDDF_10555 [Thermoplasmatota archaeon]